MTRRGLRSLLPAFAMHFGIMPWHIDPVPPVLTYGELETFVDFFTSLLAVDDDG